MRLVFITILLLHAICCTAEGSPPSVYTELLMGTVVEISLWENGEIADIGFKEIKRIENKLSRFEEDSEISGLNNDPNTKVSDECRFLISESKKYSEITGGAFDISYAKDKYDLGGIAKGYAADKTAEIFKNKGVKRAIINIGGNLYLIGYPPGKDYWEVGIKDPKNPNKLIGKIKLGENTGVSTSGNYERPGHIINPKTGKTADRLLSVTITAKTAMEADALSTGVFVMGREKGAELIEELPDVEGVIIDKTGVWISSGLKDKYEPRTF